MSDVRIVCAKAPRHVVWVIARRVIDHDLGGNPRAAFYQCSYCGARVKVVT